jgi:hypothetical protein
MNQTNGVRRCGLDSSGSRQGLVASSREHCNQSCGYIKGGEFRNGLNRFYPLKEDFAPCSYITEG